MLYEELSDSKKALLKRIAIFALAMALCLASVVAIMAALSRIDSVLADKDQVLSVIQSDISKLRADLNNARTDAAQEKMAHDEADQRNEETINMLVDQVEQLRAKLKMEPLSFDAVTPAEPVVTTPK